MINDLKHRWFELFSSFSDNEQFLEKHFDLLLNHYKHSSRYYHNEQHLQHMLLQSKSNSVCIDDRWLLDVTIFFHDVIYDVKKKDNELKSAIYASDFLSVLGIDSQYISEVKCLINSTSKHLVMCDNKEVNAWLLDIDLSILGSDWESYHQYMKDIRKEYAIYPMILYKKGRKKVLKRFLERERIYFTDQFYVLSEIKARENLTRELKML